MNKLLTFEHKAAAGWYVFFLEGEGSTFCGITGTLQPIFVTGQNFHIFFYENIKSNHNLYFGFCNDPAVFINSNNCLKFVLLKYKISVIVNKVCIVVVVQFMSSVVHRKLNRNLQEQWD